MSDAAAVVVVGGGVIGSSIALHLRERFGGARVVVAERDPAYARSSSRLATGGIRQQYGSPLNVALARHSVGFYKRIDELTAATARPTRAWFRQRGYLFLADAEGAPGLERRLQAQRASGAACERWTPDRIRSSVPGLNVDDVVLGVFGPEDGYLDPREVLAGLRALAARAGAEYGHGAVVEVERSGGRVSGVRLETAAGERRIEAPVVVNAAGAWAASVGRAAGVEVPVTPVRQHLFRLELEEGLPSPIPMIFDPDGTHWRLDDARSPGAPDRLVIGRSRVAEPPGENFVCDESRLEDQLRTLRSRYPVARVRSLAEAWAGLYEMTQDHNALLGEHPSLPGLVVAAGFSGHGLMLAPAVGLAVAELVGGAAPPSFDITPLAVDRFERGELFLDGALI